ncbi:hypothetical protein JQ604_15235 [Bradyrhizobium jicamae]|uniref:hypothetical protein n=1 Tax=Bradyrhizobium jicamae TaxID=280332 RepID=UPI001BA87684|nr:hypothetical protein [Bradyrhizobium jicamae]MBR0753541.1 hypothetical protein [Bradyrhizobium jicamae]
MPSIVPGAEPDYYLVINDFHDGPSFLETDLEKADLDTIIANLIAGEYSEPLRVIVANPQTGRCADVSHAVASDVLRRLELEGRDPPEHLEAFIDAHVGPDRQLTLRLAGQAASAL